MKILFVSSGNSSDGISPIIKNQGLSLENLGCELIYFTIKGKGIVGYLKNITKLQKVIKKYSPDIVHAHYSFCGFVASLAAAKPLVVSLMGSDVKSPNYFRYIIKIFSKLSWDITIVKSQDMKDSLGLSNVKIIPNGVDFDKFRPLDKAYCQNQLAWNTNQKHILFAANPKREVKNFILAQDAFNLILDHNYHLHSLHNIPNSDIVLYYNASDVVLLSSLWEGSPNVIKEAMACNTPIVSTDAGDVKKLFAEEPGYFISSFDLNNYTHQLREALKYEKKHQKTKGRDRITELGLDSETVAQNILNIYKGIIYEDIN